MAELKKVTLDELIKKAAEEKGLIKKTRQLYVKSLDGVITIEKPDRKLCLDVMDSDNADDGNNYLVYECTVEPNLKDKALQDAYKVTRPQDIVEKIFEPGEIDEISKQCVALAGYVNSVKPVEDIKN